MTSERESKLSKLAAKRGWRLEREGNRYRLLSEATGTLVAADWSQPGGGGLTLAQIETALASS